MKRTFGWLGICLVVAISGLGCAQPSSEEGKEVNPLPQEERCVRLLRDLRLFCKDGLRDGKASNGKDCLSRRLELRKLCY